VSREGGSGFFFCAPAAAGAVLGVAPAFAEALRLVGVVGFAADARRAVGVDGSGGGFGGGIVLYLMRGKREVSLGRS
jgi:hypothetical protein